MAQRRREVAAILPTLYRNEGTNEGNHRPQYRDAYVSGILIDDDLTPAITTLDGMVEQPSAVF